MGVSTPSAPDVPPEPETVKYTQEEVLRARQNAKKQAAKRFGVSGTNVTGGMITNPAVEAKKKTLGGE